ncbi:MAG: hypothetical protein IJD60_10525 [Clostridia bacterium]|nr:hypothetical protein [Clostridia bacterium]
MENKRRRWALGVLAACVLGLAACALAVFFIDPFELYRESSVLPLYNHQSYSIPGIAKHYDYNAVVLGTSMVEMMHPSVIDECMGVRAVKLPMRGSYTAQMGWELDHIYRYKEKRGETLDLAILAVDAYSLVGMVDDSDELHVHMWNDNPLDDVHYLLNRDVVLVEIPRLLANAGKTLDGKRDSMYTWTDVTFSKESMLASMPGPQPDNGLLPEDYRIERSRANIETHIEKYVREHPETRFVIYMPPYSLGYWYLTLRNGLIAQQMRSRALVCEKLLAYPNVEIYDFSSRMDWISDFDNYCDYSHHSAQLSDAIIYAIAGGENRVTSVQEMHEGSSRIREAAEAFAREYEAQ